VSSRYMGHLEEAGGLEKLEMLQHSELDVVDTQAALLLERYRPHDLAADVLPPTPLDEALDASPFNF